MLHLRVRFSPAATEITELPTPTTNIFAVDFYRATRMHSADYAVAKCMSVGPRLSVRLSATRRYCVYTVKRCLSQCISPKIAILPHFYRAMLSKRGLCCHSVSVCPSVTFEDQVKTNKHIFEIFSPSGSDTILVFSIPKGVPIFRREPPNWGVECKGVW